MIIFTLSLAVALPVFDMATNSVAKRVESSDPAVCLSRFLNYPPSKGKLGFPLCQFQDPFPPNTNFWLKGVDFTCVSPWNDESGAIRAGTAISKRHVVCAAHLPLWKGIRLLFVGICGICPSYVEATKVIHGTDIMIASLNSELTPDILPAKILPDDFAKYIGKGKGLPVVTFNQKEEAFLTEFDGFTTNTVPRTASCHVSRNKRNAVFRKPLVGGDSGNPMFLMIGNAPVLLCCLHFGGCGFGPSLHVYRREIQKAMDELCPGYKLEAFDFSKITNLRW